jgi:hypothetical protein
MMPKTRRKSRKPLLLAVVSWCAEDIQERKPEWSDEQCNAFLGDNEDEIQCEMIGRGWEVIDYRLARED